MIARVIHLYPEKGEPTLGETDHDLEQPWEFNLADNCDACKAGNCTQTTIVSKNFRDTLVVHGLTSAPMIMVPLAMPEEAPVPTADAPLRDFIGMEQPHLFQDDKRNAGES